MSTLETNTRARFYAINAIVSLAALALLFWLLVARKVSGGVDTPFASLPPLNASLNAIAATLLILGWVAIKRKDVKLHQRLMVGAFIASSLFLASYLTYHYFHGDTPYGGQGAQRYLYFSLLISHVVLSIPVLPLALAAFFFAYRRDFVRHRKVTRFLHPIWLYVSVTGVLVYLMLRPYYSF